MANGIYSAAAGMAAQQTRLDALANDLANVSTTGYKSERVGFRDLVYNVEQGVAVGSGSAPIDAGRSFATGAIEDSSNPLSVAIEGPGFFQVKRADGTNALTRAGNFQLDAGGSLVTTDGDQLVPPIKVPKGTQPGDVSIASNGTVTVAGKSVGTINLVDVPAPNALLSVGSNLFAVTQASGPAAAVRAGVVRQGQLEASNVDVAGSMTALLDAQQTYSLSSRALQTQDQLLSMANDLKR